MARPLPALLPALLLAACSPESQAPTAENAKGGESQAANAQGAPPGSSSASLAPMRDDVRASAGLAVEGDGLRLIDRQSGRARPLAFGLARAQVMQALAFRRTAETGTNSECGAGPLDYAMWPDGLTLYFQHGRFAGWAIRAPTNAEGRATLATVAGVGLGSTRAELESAYAAEIFESSLGTEFTAGKLFGLLDGPTPSSRITHMWAGASCVMR